MEQVLPHKGVGKGSAPPKKHTEFKKTAGWERPGGKVKREGGTRGLLWGKGKEEGKKTHKDGEEQEKV